MSEFPSAARAVVNLAAIRHNVRTLRARAPHAQFMAVVKANGYGHGDVPVALAALEAGATWLGVAQVSEALDLRRRLRAARHPLAGAGAGGRGEPPILAWLYAPGAPVVRAAVDAEIDLGLSAPWALADISAAARAAGRRARVHLKIDTGMSRLGVRPEEFLDLLDATARAQHSGDIEVVGLWSHLACADDLSSAATAEQNSVLMWAAERARDRGLEPVVHLAASGGTLWHPQTHHDMVRVGIALYGISPNPEVATAEELGLLPALRWEAPLVLVKHAPAGTAVSYGATETLSRDSWLGVVPLGYSDGVPRHGSACGPVQVGDLRTRVVGRVCMDQVIVDLGPATPGAPPPVEVGHPAALIGRPGEGPSAEEWANAVGSIGYEIVSRIGPRVPREYVEEDVSVPVNSRGTGDTQR